VRNVLFMGYHSLGTACLRCLLDNPEARVAGLFTHHDNPNENVWFETPAPIAHAAGVPVHYPESLKEKPARDLVFSLAPDVIISVYYRLMVPEKILLIPPMGALNLHGSLLPKYRGRVPVNWVLVNGEKETGVTLHYMVKKPDAGDIVDQASVLISFYDTARSLFDKVNAAGVELFRRNLPAVLAGTNPRTPQDNSKATYFGGRKPEDGRIDWGKPALVVYNLIRAVTRPYPGAFTHLPDGRKLTIWWAVPAKEGTPSGKHAKGKVVLSGGAVFVTCGEGTFLRLIDVEETGADETPGNRAVPARDWFAGKPTGLMLS
jgi:methionyl-tRNA formyltransferase